MSSKWSKKNIKEEENGIESSLLDTIDIKITFSQIDILIDCFDKA